MGWYHNFCWFYIQPSMPRPPLLSSVSEKGLVYKGSVIIKGLTRRHFAYRRRNELLYWYQSNICHRKPRPWISVNFNKSYAKYFLRRELTLNSWRNCWLPTRVIQRIGNNMLASQTQGELSDTLSIYLYHSFITISSICEVVFISLLVIKKIHYCSIVYFHFHFHIIILLFHLSLIYHILSMNWYFISGLLMYTFICLFLFTYSFIQS